MQQHLNGVTFLELLSDDLYTTFFGFYNGRKVVVKFFTDKSDANNETEVMQYFKEHSSIPELYPTPYFSWEGYEGDYAITIDGVAHVMFDVFRVICYEYLEGEQLTLESALKMEVGVPEEVARALLAARVMHDVSEHLADIHSMGFVFGDLHFGNIILSSGLGLYILIDYGRVFSVSNPAFPPMEYMLQEIEGGLPTQEEDVLQLARVVSKLSS